MKKKEDSVMMFVIAIIYVLSQIGTGVCKLVSNNVSWGGCVISFNRIVYMYDTAGGVVLHKVGDSGYQVLDKTEE